MNNLDTIKEAARRGYSAILNEDGGAEDLQFTYKVVNPLIDPEKQDMAHYRTGVLLDCGSSVSWYGSEQINRKKWTIKGYVYAGHLFGGPVIPEGQRFRVRKAGEIAETFNDDNLPLLKPSLLHLKYSDGSWNSFSKEDIEPVFE